MGTLVLWGIPDVSFAVPLWVIILAILLGLLVLAILTLAMWKVLTQTRTMLVKSSSAIFMVVKSSTSIVNARHVFFSVWFL